MAEVTALHVHYRPKTLKQVLGHDAIKAALERAIKARRSHAFIFAGPSGCGKTTLARIAAAMLAGGEGSQANVDPVDAATHNGVEAVRALVAKSQYRAIGKSQVKAIIVDECHRLTIQSWEALLAATEEGPDHVFWFFCSTEPGRIPKTVQTRCLRFDLKPLDENTLLELLCHVADDEKFDTSDEVLEAIAENAEGSPRQALVALELCHACKTVSEANRLMAAAGQATKEIIDLARWLVNGRAHNWAEATKYLDSLKEADGESIRISLVNYLSVVAMNAKSDKEAFRILGKLEPFTGQTYNRSDKHAPLLLAIGQAIGLNRG